jgi:hypothetical protein
MIRLAAMLHRSIREIEELGSDELEEWLAFERLYGIPDIYFLTAQICTTLELCLTNKKKFHAGDHVPYFADNYSEQTPGEMLANLRAATRANDST